MGFRRMTPPMVMKRMMATIIGAMISRLAGSMWVLPSAVWLSVPDV
jgi:hypothetical protein